MFIAFLHCSFRKNCILNVLLCEWLLWLLLLLILELLFLHSSNICFWNSWLLLTTSITKFVKYSLLSFTTTFIAPLHFLVCFHKPLLVIYFLPHTQVKFFCDEGGATMEIISRVCFAVNKWRSQSFFLKHFVLHFKQLYFAAEFAGREISILYI